MSYLPKRAQALRRFALALAGQADELCAEISEDLDLALGELRGEQLPSALALLEAWSHPEAIDASVRAGERRPTGAVVVQVEPRAALTDLCRVMPAAFLSGCPQVVVNLSPALARVARRLADLAERSLPGVVFSAIEPAAFLARSVNDPYCHALWVGGEPAGMSALEASARAHGQPLVWERASNDAVVLGAKGELAGAVRAASGAFRLGGGERAGVGRVYVSAARHDAFVEAICAVAAERTVEDPRGAEAMVSPLRSEADREVLLSMLDAAEDAGASLDVGLDFRRFGDDREPVLYPTVVSGCDPTLAVVTAVKPGPVLAVVPFADEAELREMLSAGGGACALFGVSVDVLAVAARRFGQLWSGHGADDAAAVDGRLRAAMGPADVIWWGADTLRGPVCLQRLFTRPRGGVRAARSARTGAVATSPA